MRRRTFIQTLLALVGLAAAPKAAAEIVSGVDLAKPGSDTTAARIGPHGRWRFYRYEIGPDGVRRERELIKATDWEPIEGPIVMSSPPGQTNFFYPYTISMKGD